MRALFGGSPIVVVDELHAFLGTERGSAAPVAPAPGRAGHPPPRAADRPVRHPRRHGHRARVPPPGRREGRSSGSLGRRGGQELKVQVRGYRDHAAAPRPSAQAQDARGGRPSRPARRPGRRRHGGDQPAPLRDAAGRPPSRLRQLPQRRRALRRPAARLLRAQGTAERVLAAPRQPLEGAAGGRRAGDQGPRRGRRPPCAPPPWRWGSTSGAIESIAQIGRPPSVASLRQRLGRSGAQGGAGRPAHLHPGARDRAAHARRTTPSAPSSSRPSPWSSLLLERLVRAAGDRRPCTCRRSSSRCCRSSPSTAACAPTRPGGLSAATAPSAPSTRPVSPSSCAAWDARADRSQTPDGRLLLDLTGEKIVNHYASTPPSDRRGVAPDQRWPQPRHASDQLSAPRRPLPHLRRPPLAGHRGR